MCAAREQCLNVANSLVGKITGTNLSLPPKESLAIIDRMLKTRRGKHAVVVALPQPDLDRLTAHQPLTQALLDAPEIQLQPTDGEGVLRPAGGEIPLDLTTAARALCEVLGVPMPDGLEDGEGAAEEPQDASAAPLDEDEEDFGLARDEGTQALEAVDEEFDSPQDQEDQAQETDMATGSLDEDEVAAALEEEAQDGDNVEDDDDTTGNSQRPATRSDFLDDDESSTVSNAVNPMSIRSGSVISGLERLPAVGRSRPAEGTRVEGTPPPRAKALGAVPLEERSPPPRPPPATPVRSHHHSSEERSGSMRAPPPPRVADFADDDDPSAATVTISRADLAAHHKSAVPARQPPPADPGTRVDVRSSSPPAPPRGEISGLQRKPR